MEDGLHLQRLVRDIPDFPKPGIVFKDVTPLFADAAAFDEATMLMAASFPLEVTQVVAIEARGFILGGPIARRLDAGLVPVRKPGKLPWATHAHTYELEYGTDTLEIHRDALAPGDRVLVVDDVLATGGTAEATCGLISEHFACEIVGVAILLELVALNGRARLESRGHRVESVLHMG